MIRAAFTPISKSTFLQDNPGQPVWYRYNSRSSLSVPHECNNISAGLGWPVWIGFLSTWVVRMVRENSIERCVGTGGFGCTGLKSSVVITGGNAGGNACVVLELGAFTGVKSSTISMGKNACAISSTTVHVETLTVGCDDDVFDTDR